MIIDSGNSENIVSKSMVRKLNLKMEAHLPFYKFGLIEKDVKSKVIEIHHILIVIRRVYKDEVTCDVVDMDAGQISWVDLGNLMLIMFIIEKRTPTSSTSMEIRLFYDLMRRKILYLKLLMWRGKLFL